jgi:Fe-S cluster biosynthesis and repair protein YggX
VLRLHPPRDDTERDAWPEWTSSETMRFETTRFDLSQANARLYKGELW